MRSVHRLLAALFSVVLIAHHAAWAQDKTLSTSIISSSSALDSTSQRAVNAYVQDLVDQMINGNQDQVITARGKLIEPFVNPGASAIFKTAYSGALVTSLEPGVNSDRVFVRISTQMVVAQLTDAAAVALVETALADKVSAVRYLAAKAAAAIGPRFVIPQDSEDPQFNTNSEAQQKLLAALVTALGKETDNIVVEQLLAGIGGLTLPEARERLLLGLNERVSVRAQNVHLGVAAERATLARLFNKVVRENSEGKPVPVGLLKQLIVVAGRNMRLTAKLLDEGNVHESLVSQHTSMLELSNTIVRWVAVQKFELAEDTLPKNDIEDNVDNTSWPEIRLRAEEWVNILNSPPFRFSARVMSVDGR